MPWPLADLLLWPPPAGVAAAPCEPLFLLPLVRGDLFTLVLLLLSLILLLR